MKHIIKFFHSSSDGSIEFPPSDYNWNNNQSNDLKETAKNNGVYNFSFDGGDLWIRKKIDYIEDVVNCIKLLDEVIKNNENYKSVKTKESRFSITYSFPDPNIFSDYMSKGKGEPSPNYLGIKKKDFKYSYPRSPYCYYDLIPFIFKKNTLYIDWIFLRFFLRQCSQDNFSHKLNLLDAVLKIYKGIKKVHIKENDGLNNNTRMKKFMTDEPHWAQTNSECGGVSLNNIFADSSFEYYAKEHINVKCPNKNSVSPVDYLNDSPPNHDEFVYGKMEDLEHVQMTKEDKQNLEKFKKIFDKKTIFLLDENIKRVVWG
jgi:hypothetical protein